MRPFVHLFGISNEGEPTDMRKLAIAAVRAGYAIVPVRPGGKSPLCTLNSRELKKAGVDHRCGVHHAITDDKEADRVFKRMPDDVNIGIVAGPSRLVVVDADTIEAVEGFRRAWADAEADEAYLEHTPTVRTPGSLRDGEWRHKDGGHWYFDLPAGIELPDIITEFTDPTGWNVRWEMQMTVAPPSVRSEGAYVPTGGVIEAPGWLIEAIEQAAKEKAESRRKWFEITVDDDVAAWSAMTPWSDLLEPDGWHNTSKHDRQCGCPVYEKPGGGSTSDRSAIAHENECETYPNVEGHGPLHLFTDDPPEPLASYCRLNKTKTITKLTYVAVMRHGGDLALARAGLGIGGASQAAIDAWLSGQTAQPDQLDEPDDPPSGEPSSESQKPSSEAQDDDLTPDDPLTRKTRQDDSPNVVSDDEADADVEGEDEVLEESDGEDKGALLDKITRRKLDEIAPGAPSSIVDEHSRLARDRAMHMLQAEVASEWLAALRGDPSGWLDDPETDEWTDATEEEPPNVLSIAGGGYVFATGRTNLIVSRRGGGKTWLAMTAAREALDDGRSVAYIDMEDTLPAMRERFETMGVDIISHVTDGTFVRRKPGALDRSMLPDIVDNLARFDVVIFDVLSRLVQRLGGDVNIGNAETMELFDQLFDPLAERETCVILLAHPNKEGQRKGATEIEPAGGAKLMDNLTGTGVALDVRVPFTRDNNLLGRVELLCRKDRTGHHEEGAVLGEFVGTAGISEATMKICTTLHVDAPSAEDFVATALARIIEFLERQDGPTTKSAVRSGITASLRPHFEEAVNRGLVNTDEHGPAVLTEQGARIDLKHRTTTEGDQTDDD